MMNKTILATMLMLLLSIAIVSADALDEYVKCANEGETVNFKQLVNVKYGADGFYNEKINVTGDIDFTNAYFGDPIVGVFKAGYYKNVTKPKVIEIKQTEKKTHKVSHITKERRNKARGFENFGIVKITTRTPNNTGYLGESKNPLSQLRYVWSNYAKINGTIMMSTINGYSLFKPRLENASYFQIMRSGMSGENLGMLIIGFYCNQNSTLFQYSEGKWMELRTDRDSLDESICFADTLILKGSVTDFAIVSN